MDEMTLTLSSPITEEQFDAITDVDFDNTDRIWFHTKNGKDVEFVKSKKGKWLEIAGDLQCSECGATYHDLYPDYSDTKFCPNCGSYNGGENDQSK